MRAMRWFLAHRNAGEARKLLRTRELWFLPVVNPDGYQYTFDHERLWRKTLRDNDGNGKITNDDGVDPNRNYPERWDYDDEGSATISSDETYRGPRAASEPEVRADMNLVRQINPVSRSAITRSARCCSTRRAGRLKPQPPTTRSTRPSPGTRRSPRQGVRPRGRRTALYDQRRVHRLGALRPGSPRLDHRARRGVQGMRLRLPR